MPNGWVEPDIFLEHGGVRVYHIYKDDHLDAGQRQYWYGTGVNCSDMGVDDGEFDVRELATYCGDSLQQIALAIRAAIDSGELRSSDE